MQILNTIDLTIQNNDANSLNIDFDYKDKVIIHNLLKYLDIKFKNKVDKSDSPYMEHLKSVALVSQGLDKNIHILQAALLHDLFEDIDQPRDILINELRDIDVSEEAIAIALELTKNKNESYLKYIERLFSSFMNYSGDLQDRKFQLDVILIKVVDWSENVDKDRLFKIEDIEERNRLMYKYWEAMSYARDVLNTVVIKSEYSELSNKFELIYNSLKYDHRNIFELYIANL